NIKEELKIILNLSVELMSKKSQSSVWYRYFPLFKKIDILIPNLSDYQLLVLKDLGYYVRKEDSTTRDFRRRHYTNIRRNDLRNIKN
ncbi:MAG TPA: hypothetical protein PLG47_05115, partial [Candidatus Dojkabacteria bacterium]|nr:hypothetical protein [Candidatus Dojkabacteria bacterium]